MANNQQFTNNAASTLSAGITSSATTITLATGGGALFPALSGSQYFYGTLSNAAGTVNEIVKVTARSTDSLTVVRGQDGTTGSAFITGDNFQLRATAAAFNNVGQLDSANTWSQTQTMTVSGTGTNLRTNPRFLSQASTATLAPDISAYDQYNLTAQAAALTVSAPIGTPVDGNKLMFRILDNGTARAITWNATYTVIGVTLPTTTTVNKTTYVGCIYNANNTRWDVIAVTTQA
jgi:hypothetical protein